MTDFQRAILDSPAVLIRASAGTGKTYQLTTRFLKLLAMGIAPDTILATTFTRKAAGEIRERLFQRLVSATMDRNESEILAQQLLLPNLTQGDFDKLLEKLIANQHRLNICTLDSYFARIARCFSYALDYGDEWTIAQSYTLDSIVSESMSSILNKKESRYLIEQLFPGRAPRQVYSRLKSRILDLQRTMRMSISGAWEWPRTLDNLLDETELEASVEKLRNISPPLTKKGAPAKAWEKMSLQVIRDIEDKNWQKILEATITTKVINDEAQYSRVNIPDEFRPAFKKVITHALESTLIEYFNITDAFHSLSQFFHAYYEKVMAEKQLMSFDDVKHNIFNLLSSENTEKQIAVQDIFFRIDSSIHHLLLDEFQDTSQLEWLLLEPFTTEILQNGLHEGRSFFCVGDIKQAIYGWRGGEVSIFNSIAEIPEIQSFPLEECRRCGTSVINFINEVFLNISKNSAVEKYHDTVAQWAERFEPHTSKNNRNGFIECEFIEETEEDTPAHIVAAVRKAEELYRAHPEITIGILVRTNGTGAKVSACFSRLFPEILFSEEGGVRLLRFSSVKAIISVLRVLNHSGDSVARYFLETCPLTHEREIEGLLRQWRNTLYNEGVATLCHTLASEVMKQCSPSEYRAIRQLLQCADNCAGTAHPIETLLRTVALERTQMAEAARVQIMTIHNSKGLEFDAVILPELEKGIIPPGSGDLLLTQKQEETFLYDKVIANGSSSVFKHHPVLQKMKENNQHALVEESLSVLYVALTRARYALYMVSPPVKESHLSFAGILRNVIQSHGHTQRMRQGDPQWYDEIASAEDHTQTQPSPSSRLEFVSKKQRGLHTIKLEKSVDIHSLLQNRFLSSTNQQESERLFHRISWIEQLPNEQVPVDESWSILSLSYYNFTHEDLYTLWKNKQFSMVDQSGKLIFGNFDRVVLKGDIDNCDSAHIVQMMPFDNASDEHCKSVIAILREALVKHLGLLPEKISVTLLFPCPEREFTLKTKTIEGKKIGNPITIT